MQQKTIAIDFLSHKRVENKGIDKKSEDLQKQRLRLSNFKEDYNDIADEIYRLRKEKHNALAEKKAVSQRLVEMTAFLKKQPFLSLESLMRKWLFPFWKIPQITAL